jgi:hypothetical protein
MITKNDDDILDEFTTALYNLNDEEQNAFLEKLKNKIINHKDNDNSKDKTKKKSLAKKVDNICKSTESKSKTTNHNRLENYSMVCPYCGSKHFIKNGLNNKGEQRYICKSDLCGKSFISRTGHLNYNNQIDESIWNIFLKGFIRGLTNKALADDTGLNETTIHYLKHKIMNMVMEMTRGYNLTGVVQADEYYTRASFKGQRSIYKYKFNKEDLFSVVKKNPDYKKYGFVLYDRSHSKERLRGLSRMQICYPTALSEDNLFCGKPAGRGIANLHKLERAYVNNFDGDITFVTDKVGASNKFAEAYDLKHVRLKANKDSRRGDYHLQNINSFHGKLNKINDSDRNYATKYSEEYMSWIAWKVKEKDKSIEEKIKLLFNLVNVGENTPTIKDIKGIEFPKELRPFNWEEKTVASSKLEDAKIIF